MDVYLEDFFILANCAEPLHVCLSLKIVLILENGEEPHKIYLDLGPHNVSTS